MSTLHRHSCDYLTCLPLRSYASEEMTEAITKVFGKVESEIVEQMMSMADTDRSGEIDFEEFKVACWWFEPRRYLLRPHSLIDFFKVIMRAGPEKLGALNKVVQGMTDPDEMLVMLRNYREQIEEVWQRPTLSFSITHSLTLTLMHMHMLTNTFG